MYENSQECVKHTNARACATQRVFLAQLCGQGYPYQRYG